MFADQWMLGKLVQAKANKSNAGVLPHQQLQVGCGTLESETFLDSGIYSSLPSRHKSSQPSYQWQGQAMVEFVGVVCPEDNDEFI